MLVGLIDGVEVVGTAADGVEAVECAEREHPDVVLMDLRMPGMDGAEATHRIRATLPDTQVMVLTTYADDQWLFPALQAGARGYLTKDASAEEIEHAIRALAAGQTHLDPRIQQRLVAAVLDAKPLRAPIKKQVTCPGLANLVSSTSWKGWGRWPSRWSVISCGRSFRR
jgi:DNA-binding NarL/FixJ family response regulator